MKVKKKLLVFMQALLISFIGFAQEKEISGTVNDNEGLPLPGVSVVIKGTPMGVQTDFDGHYSIKASVGQALQFSYVGKKSIERTVGNESVLNIVMEDDVASLEEVVVVAYGTTTKESFTGTATTVKTENIATKSFSNISQSLAGEAAGVNVINTSGQPGTSSTIRIRGYGSVNGNRAPLYVVDGVPFNVNVDANSLINALNSINPADIESTTILKDATATAIYGARGANGVVVITTKKGKAGEPSIEVDVKTGFNFSLLKRYDVIRSPETYIGLAWEGIYNRGVATGNPDPIGYANTTLFSGSGIQSQYNMWNVTDGGGLIDPETRQVRPGVTRKYNPENWLDYAFQTSIRREANLKFSGGNDKSRYYSSFGYLDDEGYIVNSDYKRYSTRLNLEHKPKDWLTASVNLGYAYSEMNNNGQTDDTGSVFLFVDNAPSIYPLFLRDGNGNFVEDPIFGGHQYDYGVGRAFSGFTNAIADAKYDKNHTKRHELNGNFSFKLKLHENLNFETQFGAQYYNNRYFDMRNPFYGSAASQVPPGSIYKNDTEFLSKNFLQLLRYNNNWGNHNIEALVAHESSDWKNIELEAGKSGLVHPDIDDLNNFVISSPTGSYTDKLALESYFAQINYNYDGKYYLSASARRDGSSRFVKDKWGTFGSVGISWILSKETFMEQQSLFEFLKLKTSYGLVGEQAGVGLYPGYDTYDILNLNGQISLPIRDNGNPDLTWETSKMFQAGVEFGLWGNFIEGSVDYYIKNTDNLLFDRRVGPSQGIAIITVNDGQLRNKGLEFDLTAHLVNNEDFGLDFSVNGAFLDNEITKMPIDPATGMPKAINVDSYYGMSEGHSIYDFYLREWAGVDAADGTAMWYQYFNDTNGNGQLDSGESSIQNMVQYLADNPNIDLNIAKQPTKQYANATQKYIGKSAIPKVNGAFRLSARYKKFNLSTQFIYRLGGYAYDAAYAWLMDTGQLAGSWNFHKDALNRWQQPGDITDVPRLSHNYDTNIISASTRYLTKADFLSLNNVRLGYTLDNNLLSKTGIDNINVWVSGDNLMLLSARDGFNPSTSESGASNAYRYSPLSTVTMGVNVKF